GYGSTVWPEFRLEYRACRCSLCFWSYAVPDLYPDANLRKFRAKLHLYEFLHRLPDHCVIAGHLAGQLEWLVDGLHLVLGYCLLAVRRRFRGSHFSWAHYSRFRYRSDRSSVTDRDGLGRHSWCCRSVL